MQLMSTYLYACKDVPVESITRSGCGGAEYVCAIHARLEELLPWFYVRM